MNDQDVAAATDKEITGNHAVAAPHRVPATGGVDLAPRRRLYHLAKRLYRAIPPGLREFAYPIAFHSVLRRRLRTEVWVLQGEERSSQLPLSVCLYATTSAYKSYLQDLIFGDSVRAHYQGRAWLWNAFRDIPENCSMVIAEVHERHLNLMGASRGVVIPAWISRQVDLPRAPKIVKSPSIKSTLRKMQQHSLEAEVVKDQRHFEDFYHNMYLPYSNQRHGEGSFLTGKEEMQRQFDCGELLLVKKQGAPVAGLLVSYDGAIPFLRYVGVRNGDWALVRDGVVAAGYEFLLQHLEATGHRKVNFGTSRGLLNDGVLRFKRQVGQAVVGVSEHKFVIRIVEDTTATRSFLHNTPFIFEHAGQRYGAVFVADETPTPQRLQEITKQHSQAGLSRLIVCFLSSKETPMAHAGQPELSQPQYEELSPAEWTHLIGALGKTGIKTVVAISLESATPLSPG